MKFQCISCGAPRTDADDKFSACAYCGGLPEVSLSHDSSVIGFSIKSEVRGRLEKKEQNRDDIKAETSLIVLYLLDDLHELALSRIEPLLGSNPYDPELLILSATVDLKERGVRKTKIATIDKVVSKLNLAVSSDAKGLEAEVKCILDIVRSQFYEVNSIKPSKKFLGLCKNLSGISPETKTVLLEILQ